MPRCELCGESTKLFQKRHKACEERLANGRAQIIEMARTAALAGTVSEPPATEYAEVAEKSFLSKADLPPLLATGFEQAVDGALEDGILTAEEETALEIFRRAFSLPQELVDRSGALTRMVKAGALRELLEGTIPERVVLSDKLPFNFQKGEKLVWAFPGVRYCETRVSMRYRGSYQGVSVRVAKGLYYRTGGFQGKPTPTEQIVTVGTGGLAVTTKHIYFSGDTKSFRIPYAKIVAFEPYTDGIGVQRDAANARQQLFITGDGWFTYNLVTNLARMAAA